MSVFVCACMRMHVFVHKMYLYRSIQDFVFSYETQISLLDPSHTILHHFLKTFFLIQDLSVDMELIVWLRWPANEHQLCPCFSFPQAQDFQMNTSVPQYYLGNGDVTQYSCLHCNSLCIGSSLCSSLKC